MKLNPHAKLTRSFRAILIAASALMGAGSMEAQNFFDNAITVGANTINLGNASGGSSTVVGTHKNWAIFALSGGVTITDPDNTLQNVGNNYDVLGNVGMAGGVLTMTNSWIKGSAYPSTGTGVPIISPYITNTGTAGPTVNAAYLSSAVASANNSSTQAASIATLTTGLSYTYNGGTAAIPTTFALNGSGGPGTAAATFSGGAAGQTYVLNLTDLVLSGVGAVLTLNGTATTNYVINVSRYMSLSANSQIALSGGMSPSNVLFNVKNTATYDVTLSGGASVKGIILAPNRNVKLTGGAVVNGEVIAKGVSLSGRSKVLNPFVSP
jgi:choice-of-anchor A domain-containing protein